MNKTLEDEIKRLYKECGVDPSAKPKIRNKINDKIVSNKINDKIVSNKQIQIQKVREKK